LYKITWNDETKGVISIMQLFFVLYSVLYFEATCILKNWFHRCNFSFVRSSLPCLHDFQSDWIFHGWTSAC